MKSRKSQEKKKEVTKNLHTNYTAIHDFKKTYHLFGDRAESPQLNDEHLQKSMPNIILGGERLCFPS